LGVHSLACEARDGSNHDAIESEASLGGRERRDRFRLYEWDVVEPEAAKLASLSRVIVMQKIGLIARPIVGEPLVNVRDACSVKHAQRIGRRLPFVAEDCGNIIVVERGRISLSQLECARVQIPLDGVTEEVGQQEQALFGINRRIEVNFRTVQVTDECPGDIPRNHTNTVDVLQVFFD